MEILKRKQQLVLEGRREILVRDTNFGIKYPI